MVAAHIVWEAPEVRGPEWGVRQRQEVGRLPRALTEVPAIESRTI